MQFSKSIDDDTDIQDTGDEPKRRGCLFYTLLIVLVLPLLLLALAPAILSTSAARNLILAQLNQPLSIRGWYFSWFTPQTISGITYRDEANGITVEVERISISKGLIRLIPIAGLDLGRIEIRRPKIAYTLPGPAAKRTAQKPTTEADQTKFVLPISDIAGEIDITGGELRLGGLSPETLEISGFNFNLNLVSMNAPAQLKVSFDAAGGTVQADARIQSPMALANGDFSKLGTTSVSIKNIDLNSFSSIITATAGHDWIESGRLNGDFHATAHSLDSIDCEGALAFTGLSFNLPAVQKPTQPSDVSFKINGSKSKDQFLLRSCSLTSPWLNMASAGEIAGSEIKTFELKTGLSFPAIAADFGPLLKLGENVGIRSGTATAQVKAAGTPESLFVDFSAQTQNLELSVEGHPLILNPAPVCRFKGTINTKSPLKSVVDELRIQMPFASVGGAGTIEKVSAEALLDLTAFTRDFRRVFPTLPPLYGKFGVTANTLSVKDSVSVNVSAQGDNLIIETAPGVKIMPDNLKFSFAGAIPVVTNTPQLRIDQAEAKLGWDGFAAECSWDKLAINPPGLNGFTASFRTSLPALRRTFGPALPADFWAQFKKFSGTILVNTTAELAGGKTAFNLETAFQQLAVETAAVRIHERDIRIKTAGLFNANTGVLALDSLSADAKILRLKGENITVAQKPLSVTGGLSGEMALADLKGVLVNQLPRMEGALKFGFLGDKENLNLSAALSDFILHGTNGIAFTEKRADLNLMVKIPENTESFDIREAAFVSSLGKVLAAGTVKDAGKTCQIDFSGQAGVNFDEVTKLAAAYGLKDFVLSGYEMRPFRIGGHLMPAPKEFLALGSVKGRLAIGSITGKGVQIKPADCEFVLDKGQLRLDYAPEMNNGRLRLNPVINVASVPMTLDFPADSQVLDRIEATSFLVGGVMAYINPLFKNVVTSEGRVSFTLKSFSAPLDASLKQEMKFNSVLNLNDFYFMPSGAFRSILEFARLGSDTGVGFKQYAINIACYEGRIRPDPMKFSVLGTELVSKGTVGLDQTVEYEISFGLSERIVGSQLYPFAKGQIITLPISGTLSALKVNFTSAEKFIGNLGKQLLKKSTEAFGDLLNSLKGTGR